MISYFDVGHLMGVSPLQIKAPDLVVFQLPVECPAINDGAEFGFTVRTIPLTRGKFTIVDDEDFDRVNQFKWFARKAQNNWYAIRSTRKNGKQETVPMHRFILGKFAPPQIDHINNDGLDNQKINLRSCNHTQNQHNRKKVRGFSKYKGVGPKRAKWRSRIVINGKSLSLGSFFTQIEAARAYDMAALKYFGEFAKTNRMLGLF